MKTKKETIYTTDKNGNGYKIGFVSKTKRTLKPWASELLLDTSTILLLAIIYCLMILCY